MSSLYPRSGQTLALGGTPVGESGTATAPPRSRHQDRVGGAVGWAGRKLFEWSADRHWTTESTQRLATIALAHVTDVGSMGRLFSLVTFLLFRTLV
jgi:hypothetical protein